MQDFSPDAVYVAWPVWAGKSVRQKLMQRSTPEERRALIAKKARSSKQTAFVPYRDSHHAGGRLILHDFTERLARFTRFFLVPEDFLHSPGGFDYGPEIAQHLLNEGSGRVIVVHDEEG